MRLIFARSKIRIRHVAEFALIRSLFLLFAKRSFICVNLGLVCGSLCLMFRASTLWCIGWTRTVSPQWHWWMVSAWALGEEYSNTPHSQVSSSDNLDMVIACRILDNIGLFFGLFLWFRLVFNTTL